jgi:hypothetical protein
MNREVVITAPMTVTVDLSPRGAWEVRLPGDGKPLTCPTLDDAVRVGYRYAADGAGCELIVHDAYHRVLHRELVPAATNN